MEKVYNIQNGFEVDEFTYPARMVTTTAPPAPGYMFVKGVWIVSPASVNERLEVVRREAFDNINNRSIETYNLYTPLYMEYLQRETQAQTWKDSGFVGNPPPQVLAVSLPSRMNPMEACIKILTEASQFHSALDFLAGLRMKKLEVDTATSIAEVRDIEKETMASIDMVLSQLS